MQHLTSNFSCIWLEKMSIVGRSDIRLIDTGIVTYLQVITRGEEDTNIGTGQYEMLCEMILAWLRRCIEIENIALEELTEKVCSLFNKPFVHLDITYP